MPSVNSIYTLIDASISGIHKHKTNRETEYEYLKNLFLYSCSNF